MALVWPNPSVQPGQQVDVVSQPPGQLLRGMHVGVDQAGQNPSTLEVTALDLNISEQDLTSTESGDAIPIENIAW